MELNCFLLLIICFLHLDDAQKISVIVYVPEDPDKTNSMLYVWQEFNVIHKMFDSVSILNSRNNKTLSKVNKK